MKKFKLSLCMIVKDEYEQLERCLLSIKDYVDEINITVTSSDQNTWKVAEKYATNIEYFDWCKDFSKARNSNFNLATNDYVLWLDSDDVIQNPDKLQEVLNLTFSTNKDAVIMFPYNYEFNDSGLVVSKHWRERIISKGTFKWVGRIHETFIPLKPFINVQFDKIVVNHLHKKGNETDKHIRNLELLEIEYKENPNDARTIYYLANTLKGLNRTDEAIPLYLEYIKISGWDEEKYIACVRLADIFMEKNDLALAESYTYKAIGIKHNYKEAYFKLGQIEYARGNFEACIHWLNICLKTKIPQTLIVTNPRNYDYNPLLLLADCYFKTEQMSEAVAAYNKLLEFTPGQKDLLFSKSVCERALRIKNGGKAFIEAVNYCLQNEELIKAHEIAQKAPVDIRDIPAVKALQIRCKKIHDRILGYEQGKRPIPPTMNYGCVPDVKTEKKYNALLVNLVARPDIINILDVGCFNGWMANDLGRRGWKPTGIDIGHEPLELAKHIAAKEATGARFEKCKYSDVGSKYLRKFDAVTCFDVLEHVVQPEKLIENLELACKKDGWIFLNIPNGAWHKGNMDTQDEDLWEHAHSYEYKDLVKLLIGKKNLEIVTLWSDSEEGQLRSPGQSSLFVIYQNSENTGRTIEIYCGYTPESWSPESVKSGIGGSEEATINIANEFTKLGHKVIVYNNCGKEAVYDDVAYMYYDQFDFTAKHDIVIGWRNPLFFEMDFEANGKYLWLHDVPQKEHFSEDLINRIDKIFVLSKWHRDCLPDIPESKFLITQNGVDLSYFDKYKEIPKKRYKVVYSSSPDRGLDVLLEMWPDVKKEIPEAELHVYYGWKVFDALRKDEKHLAWKRKVMNLMKQPGVINHDRVGHEELAKEFSEASVWAYPTYFTEISCITAMKAQIAGVIPVCTTLAALDETVQYGVKINGSIYDGNNLQEFKSKLIDTLKELPSQEYVSKMQEFGRFKYSWETVAKGWVSLFQKQGGKK